MTSSRWLPPQAAVKDRGLYFRITFNPFAAGANDLLFDWGWACVFHHPAAEDEYGGPLEFESQWFEWTPSTGLIWSHSLVYNRELGRSVGINPGFPGVEAACERVWASEMQLVQQLLSRRKL